MQIATEQPLQPQLSALPRLNISLEVLAYLVLVVLALFLRLAELDSTPMNEPEAQQAFATWHAIQPRVAGSPVLVDSPIVFAWQSAAFAMLGATELAARLGGVIGGLLLGLSPLLFRSTLGLERTFWLSVILLVSPIAFAASRQADSVIWVGVFSMAFLWALRQWWHSRALADALWVAGFAGALVFLAGPMGPFALLVMLLASGATLVWTIWNAPQERDTFGDDVLHEVQQALQGFPYGLGFLCLVVVVWVGSTSVMFYPDGLGHVGHLISEFLQGWSTPRWSMPTAHALLSLWVYELLLIVFAVAGWLWLRSQEAMTTLERFAISSSFIGVMLLFVYAGSRPADALVVVLPLAFMASAAITACLTRLELPRFWQDIGLADEANYPAWTKWALALLTLAVLLILSVHVQEVGRWLLRLSPTATLDETVARLFDASFVQFRYSAIWSMIAGLLLVVMFFLAASMWGNGRTLQGMGLGLFGLMALSGIGGGWNIAVQNATYPAELWNLSATSPDVVLLRQTLHEVAKRDTQGFPEIPITVLVDDLVTHDNGLLAWTLRDYTDVRFTASLESARGNQIIVMPFRAEEPDLGGSYVGQSFRLRGHWAWYLSDFLQAPLWFLRGQVRNPQEFTADTAVLWLRIDVYDGTPFEERP